MESETGFVYMITDSRDNVKIGFSIDAKKRFKSIKTSNPKVELFCSVPTKKYNMLEKFLHKELAEHRQDGEWFSPASEVIQKAFVLIERYGNDYGASHIILHGKS